MTEKEHKERHQKLHEALDELAADWIQHSKSRPSQINLLEFIQWSGKQAQAPDHPADE